MFILGLIFSIIFGLLMGSFVDCLTWRLYREQSLGGRSLCDHCQTKIAWYDNLPLVSWLLLSARCRHCQKAIAWSHPVIELATAGLFVGAWLAFWRHLSDPMILLTPHGWLPLTIAWLIVATLVSVLITDGRWMLIFDLTVLPSAVILGLLNCYNGLAWQGLLASAIMCAGFFWLPVVMSGEKWMGNGDVLLGFWLGLAFGWPNSAVVLLLGFFIGGVWGLWLLVSGQTKWGQRKKVPLGVFLSLAGLLVVLFPEQFIFYFNQWLGVFSR